MKNLNRIQIMGFVGKDAEKKTFPQGGSVASVNVATTEKWKDTNTGEWKEATQWHRVVLRGYLADKAEYIKKGVAIYAEGKLKSRTYQKDGQEKLIFEIHASAFTVVDWKGKHPTENQAAPPVAAAQTNPPPTQNTNSAPAQNGGSSLDDDLPF